LFAAVLAASFILQSFELSREAGQTLRFPSSFPLPARVDGLLPTFLFLHQLHFIEQLSDCVKL
jgi:hypothetical protein